MTGFILTELTKGGVANFASSKRFNVTETERWWARETSTLYLRSLYSGKLLGQLQFFTMFANWPKLC
jgi:hypothetical protein